MPRTPDPVFLLKEAMGAAAILLSIGSLITFWYRRRGSRYWPATHGKIEYGLTSDADRWKTNLAYSYAVEGEYYSGVRHLKARNEAQADELARNWKGQNLVVRYSTRDSSVSVVRKDDQPSLMAESF